MMKEPHMALFMALIEVGKTHLALDLLEQEYFNYVDLCCYSLHHPVI